MLNYIYPFPENSYLVTYIRRCVRALGKPDQIRMDKTSVDDTQSTLINDQNLNAHEELLQLFLRASTSTGIFDGVCFSNYSFKFLPVNVVQILFSCKIL